MSFFLVSVLPLSSMKLGSVPKLIEYSLLSEEGPVSLLDGSSFSLGLGPLGRTQNFPGQIILWYV